MKFIIDNKSDLKEKESLELILSVIKKGKISTGTYGEQYCHMVIFSKNSQEYGVSAEKRKSGTHKFLIWNENAK